MLRLGAHLSITKGLPGAIADTLELGGNCLQIFSSPPRNWSKPRFTTSETNKFKQLARRRHISPVFIHAKYLINISSSDKHLRQKSIDSLITDLNFAQATGSRGVIFHPRLDPFSKSTQKNRLLLQGLRTILHSPFFTERSRRRSRSATLTQASTRQRRGKAGSAKNLPYLILENPAQTRLPDIGFILQALKHPQLKFCLDLAHAYEAGYDLATSHGLTTLFQEIGHFIGYDNLVCIHANDSLTALSSHHDRHANIGQGHLGPHPFFIFLNHNSTKGLPFILETPAIKTEHIAGQRKNLQKLIQLRGTRLPRSFFARSASRHSDPSPRVVRGLNLSQILKHPQETASTLVVARDLLGKYLIVERDHQFLVARITETEAYIGTSDLACHASKGRTKRTEIMWDSPGKLYIYLIYGMYHCLNIVTERKGFPAAVLIRAARPIFGFPPGTNLDGPGKLCRAFGFTRHQTGTDIITSHQIYLKDISGLGFGTSRGQALKIPQGLTPLPDPSRITTTPRIGVDYAKQWAKRPWRFVLKL